MYGCREEKKGRIKNYLSQEGWGNVKLIVQGTESEK